MVANVIVTIEREFDHRRERVFKAWTDPDQIALWRGLAGYHMERESLVGDYRLGGHFVQVEVKDDDPSQRVSFRGVFTEFFEPDVMVSLERVSGYPGIDPNLPLEMRVEFTRMGREGTLIRVIRGPYEADLAAERASSWEYEINQLADFLDRTYPKEGSR